MLEKRVCGLGELILALEDLEMLGMVYKVEKFPVYFDESTQETYYDVFVIQYEVQNDIRVSYSEEECQMFQEALERLGFRYKTTFHAEYYNPVTEKVHKNVFVIEYGDPGEVVQDSLVPIMFED